MRLSKRGEYGLRAMIMLATPGSDGHPAVAQIEKSLSGRISRPNSSNKSFSHLRMLVYCTAKWEWAEVIIWRSLLARSASATSYEFLDGPLAPVKCVSQMAYEPCGCPDEETCGLRLAMGDVRNSIAKILDGTSLEDVTRRVSKVRKSLKSG